MSTAHDPIALPGTAAPRRGRIAGADPEKRRRILDGALEVFMAHGFDGASMSAVAAAAGVSKGTLYVYFADKEHLFVALIEREREAQRRAAFSALVDDGEPAVALATFGRALVRLLCKEFVVRAHRIVLAVAERMPELGRTFYENGPMQGAEELARFLERRVGAGQLAIEDTALAAAQFIDLCQSSLLRPRLFNAVTAPATDAEIDRVVNAAVAMFLKSYAAPGRGA